MHAAADSFRGSQRLGRPAEAGFHVRSGVSKRREGAINCHEVRGGGSFGSASLEAPGPTLERSEDGEMDGSSVDGRDLEDLVVAMPVHYVYVRAAGRRSVIV